MNECEICGELIDLEAQWLTDPICSSCYEVKMSDDWLNDEELDGITWDDDEPIDYDDPDVRSMIL